MPAPRIRSLIFVLIFGFACASYLQRQGIGIAAERMMPELGLTQVHIGWLMNAFLITYAVFQVPGGRAIRRDAESRAYKYDVYTEGARTDDPDVIVD